MVDILDIFDAPHQTASVAAPPAKTENPKVLARGIYRDFCTFLENDYPDPPRKPGLHASSLWKTCARLPLLAAMSGVSLVEEPRAAGSKATTLGGEFIHDGIQNKIGIPWKRIWGDWKCLACQDIVHTGFGPEKCPNCGILYRDDLMNIGLVESKVDNEELQYCGHYDGVHVHTDGVHRLFEFKTISDSRWKGLKAPKHDHIVQVHAYMYDAGFSESVVMYWNRGKQANFTKPGGRWKAGPLNVKIYVVQFDNDLWEVMKKRIRQYHQAGALAEKLDVVTKAHVLAYPRLCSTRTCELAGECPVRDACFALK